MKLIKLYSSISSFNTVNFKQGFNVIVGNPQDSRDSISHNLGKSTILKLIKFICFDGSADFLGNVKNKFPDGSFSIEYENEDMKKIVERSFARRKKGAAKSIDSIYDYTYFIRTQDEFEVDNGFRKPSFKGGDILWKPRVVSLLGFDGTLLQRKLALTNEIKNTKTAIDSLRKLNISESDKIQQIEKLKARKEEIKKNIKNLNLFKIEQKEVGNLVNEIDTRLFEIKKSIYQNETEVRKIEYALSKFRQLHFDSSKVEKIFKEVNLYFGEQLKRSFQELNDFYSNLYSNRTELLKKKLKESKERLDELNEESDKLDEKRAHFLKILSNNDAISVYKSAYSELIELEKSIAVLESNTTAKNIDDLEKNFSEKQTEELQVSLDLAKNIDQSSDKFYQIKSIYSEIMKSVLKIDAEMRIEKTSTGNLNFVLKSYKNNVESDELRGDSAKKISAAAIDLSIRCIQNDDDGFIAQDGIIDGLDKNCAEKFVEIVKKLSAKYKFQYIMTALKDKLPQNINSDDIIIELSDVDKSRLLMGFEY